MHLAFSEMALIAGDNNIHGKGAAGAVHTSLRTREAFKIFLCNLRKEPVTINLPVITTNVITPKNVC